MTTLPESCGYDAAAYALGALDAHELPAFRAHLAGCAVCGDELAAFEQITAALPLGVAQLPPPRRVRRRVLAAVRAEQRASARPAPRSPIVGFLARPAGALACAAALSVGAVGAALTLGGGHSAPAATRVYAAAVNTPTGSAQLLVRSGHARLVVHDLPATTSGHVYEVWLERDADAAPQPTRALFNVGAQGDAAVVVPGAVAHLHRVLVTQEPAGGTAVPTTAPVLVATL